MEVSVLGEVCMANIECSILAILLNAHMCTGYKVWAVFLIHPCKLQLRLLSSFVEAWSEPGEPHTKSPLRENHVMYMCDIVCMKRVIHECCSCAHHATAHVQVHICTWVYILC